MQHTDLSRQKLNWSLMNLAFCCGWGQQGPQNDFSLPCNILPNKGFQNKKGAMLSLPIKFNFSGRNSLHSGIAGTIIVARGALL